MPIKITEGSIDGSKIRVENTWFHGLKLFFNDELLEYNKDSASVDKRVPIISKKISIGGRERIIEVFARAIFTVKIKIVVDGVKVAGDNF